jgi:hypothetical protein
MIELNFTRLLELKICAYEQGYCYTQNKKNYFDLELIKIYIKEMKRK